jgi:hypothetical protein
MLQKCKILWNFNYRPGLTCGSSGGLFSGGNSSGTTCGSSSGTSGALGSFGWFTSGVAFGAGISGFSSGKVSCYFPIIIFFIADHIVH